MKERQGVREGEKEKRGKKTSEESRGGMGRKGKK